MELETKATHSGLEVAEQLLLDPREMGRLMRLADLQFGISRDDAQDLLRETALDIVRERKSIKNPHPNSPSCEAGTRARSVHSARSQ